MVQKKLRVKRGKLKKRVKNDNFKGFYRNLLILKKIQEK